MFPKITGVEPLDDYKIKLVYETGEVKIFDVLPYISGTWFEELCSTGYFKTVHLVSGGTGIEWEHGQDIAPHELYETSVEAAG
ncbi:MAG TPA: DUF2442 domain-containing protein [Treponema sp.]|nr:DUF2442 domain-containing protein [Treponema sp.]